MSAPIVFLTRPANHNQRLLYLLSQAGIAALDKPVLEIKYNKIQQLSLAHNDMAIFVSRNAVQSYFSQHHDWPGGVWAAAVGQVTAAELAKHIDYQRIIAPAKDTAADSEALLELIKQRNLPVARLHVLRAQAGRNWLAEQMNGLGWLVDFHQVYERNHIIWSESDCHSFANDTAKILLLTSLDALTALHASLEKYGLAWPDDLYLITLHQRIADRLKYTYSIQGKKLTTVVASANDTDLFEAIVAASDKLS